MIGARFRPVQIESREGGEEPALEQVGVHVPPEEIGRTEEYLRENRLRGDGSQRPCRRHNVIEGVRARCSDQWRKR